MNKKFYFISFRELGYVVLALLCSVGANGQSNKRSKVRPVSGLTSHDVKLWYATPAKKWSSEALPIGNGYMGGMIFGGIEKEQIQYNEKTLWSGGPGAWKGYQGGNNDSA